MSVRGQKYLLYLYRLSAFSLGIGFVISGLRKLPGVRFTQLPISDPVGLFFEGMYATGYFWNFIGIYQIIVGALLVSPYYRRLSPLLALPVTVNIFGVSAGLGMRGTPVITALMLLANLYLIIWNREAYKPLFRR